MEKKQGSLSSARVTLPRGAVLWFVSALGLGRALSLAMLFAALFRSPSGWRTSILFFV